MTLLYILLTLLTLINLFILYSLIKLKQQMANLQDELTEMHATVDAQSTVIDGTKTLLNGLNDKFDAAIAAALANGATEAQLADVKALNDQIKTKTDELAAAVANVKV